MLTSIMIFLQWIYKKGHTTRTQNTAHALFTQYFTAWSTFETPLKTKDK